MPVIRQANFTGGEIAPSLHGRSDLDRYWTSLRRLHNFLITRHGSVVNRPGTIATGNPLAYGGSTGEYRLIPFIFGADVAFVLEFGHLHVRVWHADGTPLYVPTNSSGAHAPLIRCAVATPYPDTALARLKWTQVGDVMTLVHPDYPPQELARSIVSYLP